MTTVHSTAIKVDVFPDEFRPIMQAITYAIHSQEFLDDVIGNKQLNLLREFLQDFTDTALENAL